MPSGGSLSSKSNFSNARGSGNATRTRAGAAGRDLHRLRRQHARVALVDPARDHRHAQVVGRHEVAVRERLHHVLGRHGAAGDDALALDRRAALDGDADRCPSRPSAATVSVTRTLVLRRPGRRPPLSANPAGASFRPRAMSPSNPSRRSACTRDRDRRAGAGVDLRRRDAQLEVGARRADAQAVAELGAALSLRVGQAQQVGAVGGQRGRRAASRPGA